MDSLRRRNTTKLSVQLAKKQGLELDDDFLCAEARKWELHHGGISGRTAQQFINYLQGVVDFSKK